MIKEEKEANDNEEEIQIAFGKLLDDQGGERSE
jgi:hypothetical protein